MLYFIGIIISSSSSRSSSSSSSSSSSRSSSAVICKQIRPGIFYYKVYKTVIYYRTNIGLHTNYISLFLQKHNRTLVYTCWHLKVSVSLLFSM